MQTNAKPELINQLATLLLEDPDSGMALLCKLVQRAMVIAVMNEVKSSFEKQLEHLANDLLEKAAIQANNHNRAIQ